MTNITIYCTRFSQELPPILWGKYINKLPKALKERNFRFVRWQDQHSNLFGKLLLIEGLKQYGFLDNVLADLITNKYSRPFINSEFDFNISHSGEYVLCAIGHNMKLGIDIEKIHKINFKDFKKVMTGEQWQAINHSENPSRAFFQYWTIKESVIKADGRGLSIPLQELHVKENMVVYDNSVWHLHQLSIDSEYSACLATNVENVDISLKYIDFFGENELKRRRETGNGSQEIPVNQLSNAQ